MNHPKLFGLKNIIKCINIKLTYLRKVETKSQIHKIINDKLEITTETKDYRKRKRLRDGSAKHLANKIENQKGKRGQIYKNLIFQTLASEERGNLD